MPSTLNLWPLYEFRYYVIRTYVVKIHIHLVVCNLGPPRQIIGRQDRHSADHIANLAMLPPLQYILKKKQARPNLSGLASHGGPVTNLTTYLAK